MPRLDGTGGFRERSGKRPRLVGFSIHAWPGSRFAPQSLGLAPRLPFSPPLSSVQANPSAQPSGRPDDAGPAFPIYSVSGGLGGQNSGLRKKTVPIAKFSGTLGWGYRVFRGVDQPPQVKMTLPDRPDRAAEKASLNSTTEKWWVITGAISSPDCSIAVILYQVSNISRP